MEKLREGFEGFAGPMGEALPAAGDDDKGKTDLTEVKGVDKGQASVQATNGEDKVKTNVQETKVDVKGKTSVQDTKVDGRRQRDRRGPQQKFQAAKGNDSRPKGKPS
jgi:hypothetical protein